MSDAHSLNTSSDGSSSPRGRLGLAAAAALVGPAMAGESASVAAAQKFASEACGTLTTTPTGAPLNLEGCTGQIAADYRELASAGVDQADMGVQFVPELDSSGAPTGRYVAKLYSIAPYHVAGK